MIELPIYKKDDYSNIGYCVNCRLDLYAQPVSGIAYIAGGAYYAGNNDAIEKELYHCLGFLNVGFHGNPDIISTDICIVDDVSGGQYDISFCSLECMKQWFNCIIDRITLEINQRKKEYSDCPRSLTDSVLFRWSRIIKIANIFPVMHQLRALEHKLQTVCRSCGRGNQRPDVDRSALADVRRALAECSDDKARLVKEAAGVLQYRVHYHDLSGTVRDITR